MTILEVVGMTNSSLVVGKGGTGQEHKRAAPREPEDTATKLFPGANIGVPILVIDASNH